MVSTTMSSHKQGASANYLKQEQGYRDKALKMYPWICGRCAREFVYSNLRELTVHHRDHNHDNNPARSEEHTSELQSRPHLVCRLLLEKKKKQNTANLY